MPPDTPTARAHARTCSGVSSVSEVRSIRQSGSLSQSRRCMKARASVVRQAPRVDGWVSR